MATAREESLAVLFGGKHHRHGLHLLALTHEKGRLLWISAARPAAPTTPPRPATTISLTT
ncbi:hypothetical protein [Streptomyces violaceus]|uniref:Uncharacterized protein n=1 Tax=Streptomyces violaceus TaxID=1936 RepID=A0ABZ1P1V8_STRVL